MRNRIRKWAGHQGSPMKSSWLVRGGCGGNMRQCFRTCVAHPSRQGSKLIRPRVAFWNAAALFHSEPWVARAKLRHFEDDFRGIAARADITFALECHYKEGDCIGLDVTHYEFVSSDQHNPRGSGGIVLVVKKCFFDLHGCIVRSLFDGRAVALDMCQVGSTHICSTVAGVHVTDTPQHSWSQIARAVATNLDMSKRIFVIGDLNFVDETLDSISFAGDPVGRVGQKAREWARLFPGFTQMIAGLTLWNKASRCMSALDRLYTNMDASEVLACNLVLRMTGGGRYSDRPHSSPPAQSDHHSIDRVDLAKAVRLRTSCTMGLLGPILELHSAECGIATMGGRLIVA
eukprot:6472542-Amphidinium_carterae.1